METIIQHGKAVVPTEIRKRHNIKDGDQLIWIDDGKTIQVILVPTDMVAALREAVKGKD